MKKNLRARKGAKAANKSRRRRGYGIKARSHAVTAYQCDACGWMYKPEEHSGVPFDDLSDGWTCEQCQADRDHFQVYVPSETDSVLPEGAEETLNKSVSSRRLANIKNEPTPVDTLWKRARKGTLILQPDFQRYEVWNGKTQSQLIESILADLPIPTIYLAEEQDGKFVVVDGQQRLNAIFQFIDGKYKLSGLSIYSSLEKQRFSDLSQPLQDKIEERSLDITKIFKETDKEVRFELFERLNRGSVKLNDQELRNCSYRGKYNTWLKQLATNADLRAIMNLREPHKRMVDVELVLRFMAFQDITYLNFPDKRTNTFLNLQMENCQAGLAPRREKKAQTKFNDAINAARSVFGKKAFKRFAVGKEDAPEGHWEQRINRALMDVVMYTFSRYDKGTIISNADIVFEATLDLMSTARFADLIRHTISEKRRVEDRFTLYGDAIERILGPAGKGVRLFKYSQKQTMFSSNPTCSICKGRIQDIDDAHVDHIEAWSRGGKTVPANAALSHRFCNQSKGSSGARWLTKPSAAGGARAALSRS